MQPDDNNVILNIYWGFISILQNFFTAVRKNLALLLICIIGVGALLCLYQYQNSDKYKASFTVAYDDLVRKIYGDRLYKLNILVQHKDYGRVGHLLNLPVDVVSKVLHIDGKNILGERLTEDMNTDKIPFMVEILVEDTSVIPRVQAGIVAFLETGNAFLATSKKIKIQEIEDEIKFIDTQLSMMDSLKRKYNISQLTGESSDKNASMATIYSTSYDLYKRRQELARKEALPNTIQVLDDAIAVKKSNLSFGVITILSLILGTILFLVIIVFVKPVFRPRPVSYS